MQFLVSLLCIEININSNENEKLHKESSKSKSIHNKSNDKPTETILKMHKYQSKIFCYLKYGIGNGNNSVENCINLRR